MTLLAGAGEHHHVRWLADDAVNQDGDIFDCPALLIAVGVAVVDFLHGAKQMTENVLGMLGGNARARH
jgi:hypothetical protein